MSVTHGDMAVIIPSPMSSLCSPKDLTVLALAPRAHWEFVELQVTTAQPRGLREKRSLFTEQEDKRQL